MVPLESSVVDAIHAAIYSGKATGGRLILHHITPSPDIMTTDLNVNGGPPCCDSSHKTAATDALISAFLVLSSQNISIDVLIDTVCLQTNVVRDRIDFNTAGWQQVTTSKSSVNKWCRRRQLRGPSVH